jgi:hypothetical protein
MILFHNESTIKDESSQNVIFFSYSEQCWFSYKGKAYKIKFRSESSQNVIYFLSYSEQCWFSYKGKA